VVIASWDHVDIPFGTTEVTQVLDEDEADLITNYRDLFIRVLFIETV
jgi:hypothetical protein